MGIKGAVINVIARLPIPVAVNRAKAVVGHVIARPNPHIAAQFATIAKEIQIPTAVTGIFAAGNEAPVVDLDLQWRCLNICQVNVGVQGKDGPVILQDAVIASKTELDTNRDTAGGSAILVQDYGRCRD